MSNLYNLNILQSINFPHYIIYHTLYTYHCQNNHQISAYYFYTIFLFLVSCYLFFIPHKLQFINLLQEIKIKTKIGIIIKCVNYLLIDLFIYFIGFHFNYAINLPFSLAFNNFHFAHFLFLFVIRLLFDLIEYILP